MIRLDRYKNTDAISNVETIKSKIKIAQVRNTLSETDISQLSDAIKYFVPQELWESRPYLDKLSEVQSMCSEFWSLKEDPLSYDLGCKYQKIKFDFPSNVNSEINELLNFKKIYSETNRPKTLMVIDKTISLLEELQQEMFIFFENNKKY